MFTACFDAAGSKDKPWMVVGGFVAPTAAWDAFRDSWVERLKKDGLEYFHMREFSACRGQFKTGWKGNEPRRRALLSDLIGLIQSNVSRKFGHAVAISGVEHIRQEFSGNRRKQFLLESFAIAGYSCGVHVDRWARRDRIRAPIKIIFADGDLDGQKLRELFKLEGWPAPIFRPARDVFRKGILNAGFVPLQAADLLANELYQVCPQIPNVNRDSMRWPLQQLNKIPGEPTFMGWDSYDRLRQGLHNMIPGIGEFVWKLKQIKNKSKSS